MRRRSNPIVLPIVLATMALLLMLSAGAPERVVAVRIWLVALAATAVRVVVVAVRRNRPARRDEYERASRLPAALDPAERPSLVRAGRMVTLASGSAGDLHFRVRPVLRDVARSRLADHGIDLDDPADATEVAHRCGPLLWSIVRVDRSPPEDRSRAGLSADAVPDLIAHLEAL